MEGRVYVESVTGSKVPIISCVGFVVDEDFASEGENKVKGCGVVSMGAVEVLPGGDGRIQCVLVE